MREIISTKQISEDTETVLLISNIERMRAKIKEENKKINLCIHILEQENPNYLGYLKQLEIDVSHIRDKLNLSFSEKDKINEEIDINIRDDLKVLYRKISIKCHPDKSNDLNHHELFKKAKEAYIKLDYNELKKIYEELYGKDTDHLIENKIENLKKQLKQIEQEYIELTNTKAYVMTYCYESELSIDKMKAKKIFLDMLFSKIFELETLKSNLTTP